MFGCVVTAWVSGVTFAGVVFRVGDAVCSEIGSVVAAWISGATVPVVG